MEVILPGAQYRKDREVCSDIGNNINRKMQWLQSESEEIMKPEKTDPQKRFFYRLVGQNNNKRMKIYMNKLMFYKRGHNMPISIAIDEKNDLIIRTIKGLVSTQELIDSIEYTLKLPSFHQGMKSLTDLSEATHHTNSEDIKKIAELLIKHSEKLVGGKAAVVVSRIVSFGMMRMLQSYADDSPLEISIFYSVEEAKHWLGLLT